MDCSVRDIRDGFVDRVGVDRYLGGAGDWVWLLQSSKDVFVPGCDQLALRFGRADERAVAPELVELREVGQRRAQRGVEDEVDRRAGALCR
jgi:hypothetical protein